MWLKCLKHDAVVLCELPFEHSGKYELFIWRVVSCILSTALFATENMSMFMLWVCSMIKKQSIAYIWQGFQTIVYVNNCHMYCYWNDRLSQYKIIMTSSNSDVILMLSRHKGVMSCDELCWVILKALCPLATVISENDPCDCAGNSFKLGSEVWQQATFDLRRQRSKVPFTALSVCLLSNRCS